MGGESAMALPRQPSASAPLLSDAHASATAPLLPPPAATAALALAVAESDCDGAMAGGLDDGGPKEVVSTSMMALEVTPAAMPPPPSDERAGLSCALCAGVLFGAAVTCAKCPATFHAACAKRDAKEVRKAFTCEACSALAKRAAEQGGGTGATKRAKTRGGNKVADFHKRALSAMV